VGLRNEITLEFLVIIEGRFGMARGTHFNYYGSFTPRPSARPSAIFVFIYYRLLLVTCICLIFRLRDFESILRIGLLREIYLSKFLRERKREGEGNIYDKFIKNIIVCIVCV